MPTISALVVAGPDPDQLRATLDALAAQSRVPDHVLILDITADGVSWPVSEHPLAHEVASLSMVRAEAREPRTALAAALRRGFADALPYAADVRHLWFLRAGSRPEPEALARLTDALRRSPSTGIAGPKQVEPDDPRRLHSLGVLATRTGRVLTTPVPGEYDQGQYDGRGDVLAVPLDGLLIESELWQRLGAHEAAFGDLGSDLDLSWRAHQAGRRVVVVPSARVVVAPDQAWGAVADTAARRRQGRRVALARCSFWSAPFLALWIAVTAVLGALGLLLAKRPSAAWAELADLGALLDPWRSLGARWRSRGTRQIARRDLRALFVGTGGVARHTGDRLHPDLGIEELEREERQAARQYDGEELVPESWGLRILRNPGVWAVVLCVGGLGVAGRFLTGSLLGRVRYGLTGGEVVAGQSSASSLLHAWLDGWNGSGLGGDTVRSPYLAVLAGPAWLVAHVPVVGPPASPGGTVVTIFLAAGLPLACVAAYLSGRVVTRSRLPRALAALTWVGTAAAASTLAQGRIAPMCALILLPPLAAWFSLAARRRGSVPATFGAAIGAAVLGAFTPALLVVFLLAALVLVLIGPGWIRLRALVLLLLPVALLGPWVGALVADPRTILGGPGALAWGTPSPEPWRLALLHPGGAGSYPVFAAVPFVAIGLLGLLRAGRRTPALWGLGVLALLSLAATLAAPRVTLATIPEGLTRAGAAITPWPGLPMLTLAFALAAAALVGFSDLPRRPARSWLTIVRAPVLFLWPVAALVGIGLVATYGIGNELTPWRDGRPAVAIDQAGGSLATRTVFLAPAATGMTYRLVGRETSALGRDLPESPAAMRGLAPLVAALVDGPVSGGAAVATGLGASAIGFVAVDERAPADVLRRLDATAGLTRLVSRDGVAFWRVAAWTPTSGTERPVGPPRLTLSSKDGTNTVTTTGQHGATHTGLTVPQGARLLVAEPRAWAGEATVTADGKVLPMTAAPAGATGPAAVPTYVLPAGHVDLRVSVDRANPLWTDAQLVLLAVAGFFALPVGRRSRRPAR